MSGVANECDSAFEGITSLGDVDFTGVLVPVVVDVVI